MSQAVSLSMAKLTPGDQTKLGESHPYSTYHLLSNYIVDTSAPTRPSKYYLMIYYVN